MLDALRKLAGPTSRHVTDTTPRPVTTISDVARAARRLAGDGVACTQRHRVGVANAREARPGCRRPPGLPPLGPGAGAAASDQPGLGRHRGRHRQPLLHRRRARHRGRGPRATDHRLVLCNSDEDLDTEASYIDVVVAERMAGVVIAVASPARVVAGTAARPADPGRRRRPPAGASARRRRARRQPARRRGGDRAPARAGCLPHRVHHRTATRRHRHRSACRATSTRLARARPACSIGRSSGAADFKLDGGYRAARSLLESASPPDALVRRQRTDDRRRAARHPRARPPRSRRRRARRLRRLAAG